MIDPYRFAPWVSDEARREFSRAAAAVAAPTELPATRAFYDAFNRAHLAVARDLYPADVAEQRFGDVVVHRVTPRNGARDTEALICLHGGAFMWGSGAGALLEAVPVAVTSGLTVYAVDYRLAPEYRYPAAVEDVLSVYRALRAERAAKRIGIYGCSAGGVLTAQAVARLIAEGDDLPGAIAMLHGTAIDFAGDSMQAAPAFDPRSQTGEPPRAETLPYFEGADLDDPLVLPGRHPNILGRFPPSLLITGSRDFAASAMSVMHRRLLAAGAAANFVSFDGVGHAHHMATGLPEARETFDLLAGFFRRHLG